MTPELSVAALVPTYNGAAFIAETLTSIVHQSRPVDEIIVVDDASTDDTLSVVAAVCPAATIVRHATNRGVAAARNSAVAASHSRWLAFCDHDDVWPEDRTRALLAAAADEHRHKGWIAGRLRLVIEPGHVLPPLMARADGQHLPLLLPSALLDRHLWAALGGNDERFLTSEDVELYLRFTERGGTPRLVDEVTVLHRMHPGSLTMTAGDQSQVLLSQMRDSVLRRRQPPAADGQPSSPTS